MYIVLLVTIGLHGLQGDNVAHVDISKYQRLTTKAAPFVKKAEKELEASTIKLKFAEWNFASNINENNENVKLTAEKQLSQLKRRLGTEAQQFDLTKLKDKDVRRKVELLRLMGTSALPDEKRDRFNRIVSDMRRTFNQAKVKKKDGGELLGLEELQKIMATSRDSDELQYYWEQWREETGKKIKGKYLNVFTVLYHNASQLNALCDASWMEVEPYVSFPEHKKPAGPQDIQTGHSVIFFDEMDEIWKDLKPLYQQLHAYVRTKLAAIYPKVADGGQLGFQENLLPAHLLGDMWGKDWSNIGELLRPYPGKSRLNVTGAMRNQGWDQKKMFQKAEEFFTSMGFDPMPREFWNGSILKKPEDGREVTCQASAWDFFNGKDYRILSCTRVNQKDFAIAIQKMGHIQYLLQYKNLPFLYRQGANPGFLEGVEGAISLAVNTVGYFKQLGLVHAEVDVADEEANINILFDLALQRLAFLSFSYIADKFKWELFSSKMEPMGKENFNCHWWGYRHTFQGLNPPSTRKKNQFDPGADFHTAANVGYVSSFTASIYMFQFYRAMCLSSGEYVPGNPGKPLHRCNFFGSAKAGGKLKEMMELGTSKTWKKTMMQMTGQQEMNTSAILEYFQPLEKWLDKQNKAAGVSISWNSNGNSKEAVNEKKIWKEKHLCNSGRRDTQWCLWRSTTVSLFLIVVILAL